MQMHKCTAQVNYLSPDLQEVHNEMASQHFTTETLIATFVSRQSHITYCIAYEPGKIAKKNGNCPPS